MPHIFICHAPKDTLDFALALHDALNALPTVTAWVDTAMQGGRNWELQIQSEIDKCDFFVVLYSEGLHQHQQDSPEHYVLTKIAYAKRYTQKPIIPVMAHLTQLPMRLINEHCIDFIGLGMNLEQLVEVICNKAELAFGIPITPPVRLPPSVEPILPTPFAWVDIPAGKVILEKAWFDTPYGGGQTFDVEAFHIAKYPITNAQFSKFVEAGGYENRTWWTSAGWEARNQGWDWLNDELKVTGNAWCEPRYWEDAKFNGPEQPVVGISWYEGVAFCNWLNAMVNRDGVGTRGYAPPQGRITLPTEAQWQWAAAGPNGLAYPWGDEWDATRCNNQASGIDRTTPVTVYEGKGDSPFGVVDMAGNMWELCKTEYATGKNTLDLDNTHRCIIRGGSWIADNSNIHTHFRNSDHPHVRGNRGGIRIAVSY